MLLDLDPAVLSILSALPQYQRLARVVNEIWHDPHVVALWLGGSLARDAGDPYSDVDLRLAVLPAAFTPDQMPAAAKQLEDAAVATLSTPVGDDAALFHLLLENGEMYDVFVQTTKREPIKEARLVLACRDSEFGAKLAGGTDPAPRVQPADGTTIRQVIVNFWMAQQRHQKVLYRRLPLLAWLGQHLSCQELVRLWYVLATGDDCGPLNRMTIHTLSPVIRTVQQVVGTDALALVGQPLGSTGELIQAIAGVRAEVGRVGRQLAEQLGFEYPVAVEETIQQSWQRFVGTGEPA